MICVYYTHYTIRKEDVCMKSISNIFEKLTNPINIEFAIKDAFQNKKRNKLEKDMYVNRFKYAVDIAKKIESGEYPKQYPRVKSEIMESSARKKRYVTKPDAIEHVIHHAICNELMSYFKKSFYPFAVASVPGKGDGYGVHKMKVWIKRFVKNGKFYTLKMDVHKFFDSIDRNVLYKKILRISKDTRLNELFRKIIWYDGDYSAKGIPIGFYTSQWLANFYLQSLDYYITDTLKQRYSCKGLKMMRYMDDIVILCPNKRKLHKIRNDISEYLNKELHLELKKNWYIAPFEYINEKKAPKHKKHIAGRALDYMGFVFHPDRTTLRKSTLYRTRRKANRINRKVNHGSRLNWYMCSQMLAGISRMCRCNTYNYYIKYIQPVVSRKKCIEVLSTSAKLRALKQESERYLKNTCTNLIIDSFAICNNKVRGEEDHEYGIKIQKIRKYCTAQLNRLYI